MAQITVRPATLADAAAITEIHKSNTARWQRLSPRGDVEDVPYEALNLYERWLHGGPWMSLETCAVHLTHLLRGAGLPVVAEVDGRVLAHAELYHGQEPAPLGNHLHVAVLYVHAEHGGRGLEHALLAHAAALGKQLGAGRLTIASADAQDFYEGGRWQVAARAERVTWPARTGQVFYQSTPHPDPNPAQIAGCGMPLGRGQSALQEWVTHWPDLWVGLPDLHARRVERLKFTAAGGTLYVLYAESLYDPRLASVYVWTAKPLTNPVLAAISDRAHKLGFRRLETLIRPDQIPLLGPETEAEGLVQESYALDL